MIQSSVQKYIGEHYKVNSEQHSGVRREYLSFCGDLSLKKEHDENNGFIPPLKRRLKMHIKSLKQIS